MESHISRKGKMEEYLWSSAVTDLEVPILPMKIMQYLWHPEESQRIVLISAEEAEAGAMEKQRICRS